MIKDNLYLDELENVRTDFSKGAVIYKDRYFYYIDADNYIDFINYTKDNYLAIISDLSEQEKNDLMI